MDKLLGKAADKLFGDDDERPQSAQTAPAGIDSKRLTAVHADLQQGGGNRTPTTSVSSPEQPKLTLPK